MFILCQTIIAMYLFPFLCQYKNTYWKRDINIILNILFYYYYHYYCETHIVSKIKLTSP